METKNDKALLVLGAHGALDLLAILSTFGWFFQACFVSLPQDAVLGANSAAPKPVSAGVE